MGIRACLSVLLIAGALHVPLFSAHAEEVASTTPETAPVETATTSNPATVPEPSSVPVIETASSSASSTSEIETVSQATTSVSSLEPATLSPFDRGFGIHREELPTNYENHAGYGAFAIHAIIDGVSIDDGAVLDIIPRSNIHIHASTTIAGTDAISADEIRALGEVRHTTFALYRGVPGNAEMVAGTYTISGDGILSDIGGTPLTHLDVGPALSEPGEYFIAVHPELESNQYPAGWGPHEFGGPRIDLVPRWNFWANHDFYTKQTLYQGSQVFGILRFTIGAPTPEHQMSNVLFLPGIKASRLYGSTPDCSSTDCEILQWEPVVGTRFDDISLDSFGRSARSIFTKKNQIIGRVELLNENIYATFAEELQALRNGGQIEGWEPVAYDWRLSLEQIIESGRMEGERIYYDQATDSPYIEMTLRELASTSKSGKVTIVAHSNGGLVAKALMQKLGNADTAALIDNVILLGTPQAGAPQTIGALLFGHKEGLPFDWLPVVVSVSQAREFALNSPMSYHLLPTERYFESLTGAEHPVARFYADTHHVSESTAYREVIDSVDELHSFLRADEGGRSMPERSNLESANVLNPLLLSYAKDIHARLDTWSPPEGVTVYQVAGWGEDTIAGYEFYEDPVQLPFFAGSKPKFRPIFVEEGDGVVPAPSALAMPQSERVKNYWINLRQERQGHATLLESERVRDLIQEVLRGQEPQEVLDHVSRNGHSPWIVRPHKQLRFALHSPLTLSVSDEEGNTVGLMENGDIADEIDGGRFGQIGETKFVSVPSGPTYTVTMHGFAEGSFSLDIEEIENGAVTKRKTFAGLPSSAATIATLEAASVATLTSLVVDTDGDGTEDIELPADAGAVTIYEPVTPNAPTEPQVEQPTETESTSSSSGGRSSQNNQPETSPTTAFINTIEPVSVPEQKEFLAISTNEVPTFIASEKFTEADAEEKVDVKVTAPETRRSTESNLSASVFSGFQQLWTGFIVPVLYTIKETFIKLLNLFV